jgi:membrane-associated phospholipid phosphatase
LALAAAGCFAGVAALWLLVEYVGPFPGDERAAAAAANGPLVGLDLQIVSFFGQLGTEAVAAMTVLVACAALWSALGLRAAAWVLGASLAAVLANDVLKAALGPTPLAPDPSEPNFPSGHVVYATAFFGSLGWLAWRRHQPEAVAICAFAILAMGPARVLSGSHLVSDTLAGYLFGAGWLLALTAAFGHRGARSDHRATTNLRAIRRPRMP